MNIINYLLLRLKEPSTWLGMTLFGSAFFSELSQDQQYAIQTLGIALFSVPDKQHKQSK